MALIELANVIADDPAASRRWAAEPLPPSDRLTAVITGRFAVLPEPARAALLLAAVADGPDLGAAARRGGGSDAQILAPAEQLGMIKVDRVGLQFSPPRSFGHLPLRTICRTGGGASPARRGAGGRAGSASLAPGRRRIAS
jgi:hypothetical protein